MAAEWIGVAGAALGAGIGGLVTVASLVISTRHDARARQAVADRDDLHRAEDRVAGVRTHQFAARRDVYITLITAADELRSAVRSRRFDACQSELDGGDDGDGDEATTSDDEQRGKQAKFYFNEVLTPFNEKLRHFSSAAAATELTSYEPVILDIARAYTEAAFEAFLKASSFRPAEYDKAREALDDVRAQLSAACRRDLGYETG